MTRGVAGNIRRLSLLIALAFLVTTAGAGYWTLVASDALARDPFNPRLLQAIRDRPRGAILDSAGNVLAQSVRTTDGYVRRYSDPSLAHVVGYASFKYGASGVEAAYADSLIGQDPADPVASWRARYLGDREAAGAVVLGIDPKVQRAAVAALAGRRGAAIALDPRTGTILASVSLPSYDPNEITTAATQDAAWQRVSTSADHPLIDRPRQGVYAPGSTFKLVTGATALESGVDPNAKLRVDDPWQADRSWGDYYVRSSTHAHGDFTMADAYRLSENIYFAQIGLRVGGPRLAQYAQRFGIGAAPRCDLPVAAGQLSNTGTLDRPTLVADTSYGQGELLVSPLQMALVAAAIGRGGVMPAAHYVTEVRDGAGNPIRTVAPTAAGQIVTPATAAAITQLLVGAVSGPGAFAYGARIPGVNVAGKTGTAENPLGSPHGWFVGFAPAEAPIVAVAVIIENAGQGGLDAAPVGARIMQAALGR